MSTSPRALARKKPGPRCTVCSHPSREAIDGALAAGLQSLRIVAERHGVGKFAVFRHGLSHLPQALAKATEAAEVVRADRLMAQLLDVNRQTRAILAGALKQKDPDLALRAIARLERQIELEARLAGELPQGQTVVNLSVSAEWREVRALVFGVLGAHPEARLAVAAALERRALAG